jgi:hypothetical protein
MEDMSATKLIVFGVSNGVRESSSSLSSTHAAGCAGSLALDGGGVAAEAVCRLRNRKEEQCEEGGGKEEGRTRRHQSGVGS